MHDLLLNYVLPCLPILFGMLWGGCCCNNGIPCTACSGSTPIELELVITGYVIGTCSDGSHPASCLDYNATHILTQVLACRWEKTGFLNCPPVDDILSVNLLASPRRASIDLGYGGANYNAGGTTWDCSSGAVIVPFGNTPTAFGPGGCDLAAVTYGLSVV